MISESARDAVGQILKSSFRPEFLNRLDEIIYFTPLSRGHVLKIADIAAEGLVKRLSENRIGVKLTDRAKEYIIERSYDPLYGARPLKRFLQSEVETLIAKKIIGEDISPDTELTVDFLDGRLTVDG